jgi:hypothetical protein
MANADQAVNPASVVYAQGTESENTYYSNLTVCEGLDNIGGRFRAGLTAVQITRFWSKVQRAAGCWEWQAGKFRNGYGMFGAGRFPDGRSDTRYTHRVAYELTHGPIPNGLQVLHTCDNPPCCNPAHLQLGTHLDNMQDSARKGRKSGERPKAWSLPADVYRSVLAECLSGPRGTMVRLARQHGVMVQMLSLACRRHRARHRLSSWKRSA